MCSDINKNYKPKADEVRLKRSSPFFLEMRSVSSVSSSLIPICHICLCAAPRSFRLTMTNGLISLSQGLFYFAFATSDKLHFTINPLN